MNFASVVLAVLPTLPDRGAVAVIELVAHGLVAAFACAAGLALWHETPDSRRLATAAIIMSAARVAQSVYWTVLPTNTMPGDKPLILAAALVIAAAAVTALYAARSTSTSDHRM